ncbi:MAG TPA: hypothetical protein VLX68_12520 [Chitinivibrionales bacterium]|nr:hypothetical protein [Chitinivibrionales bacterium]
MRVKQLKKMAQTTQGYYTMKGLQAQVKKRWQRVGAGGFFFREYIYKQPMVPIPIASMANMTLPSADRIGIVQRIPCGYGTLKTGASLKMSVLSGLRHYYFRKAA